MRVGKSPRGVTPGGWEDLLAASGPVGGGVLGLLEERLVDRGIDGDLGDDGGLLQLAVHRGLRLVRQNEVRGGTEVRIQRDDFRGAGRARAAVRLPDDAAARGLDVDLRLFAA